MHTAERVQIGLRGDASAADLLGRHVLVGADGAAGGGQLRDVGAQNRRDAEVEDLHGAVTGDEDVARLEVPVDDRHVVRVRQHGRDLGGDGGRPADRQRPAGGEVGGQRYAVDELHHQEQPLVRRVEHRVVHLRHAGVLDARGDAGLAAEALGELLGQLRGGDRRLPDELHGDGPVEHGVVAAPHVAHAAVAELLQEFVTVGDRLLRHLAPGVRDEQSHSGVKCDRRPPRCRVPSPRRTGDLNSTKTLGLRGAQGGRRGRMRRVSKRFRLLL
jgi:hypothetical protein